jgi:hypothetical protein
MVDYNPNIPQPTDNLSTSQGQILNNFSQLESVFATDHYTWDYATVAFRGKHTKISFPATISVVAQTGLASVLYSKDVSSVAAPYFDNSVGTSVLWRGGNTNGLVTVSSSNLTLPNGLQFSYGSTTTNGSGNATINWNFPNNLYSATLTRVITGGNNRGFVQWTATPTRTSGTARMLDSAGTGIAGTFYWIAIGN